MWKLLRNSVLVAILLAGLFKLALWYAIQQGGSRLVAQLAPIAQVQYSGVTATLNGTVAFSAVSVVPGKEKGRDAWRASSVELETPGALWLARRLFLGDEDLPEHLVVTINGMQAPAGTMGGVSPWLGPVSLVPFETIGCGIVSRFSVGDYQRMGLNPGAQQQRIDYRYDAAASTLSVAAELRSPPFSTITLRGEATKFDPRALASGGWPRMHVGELNVGYVDAGYLAKRNQFCAQQAEISPAQFVEQHLAAVTAFLGDHGIEAGSEAAALYRSLLTGSGRVSILSLPAATSTLGQLLAEAPDAMVRRLNLTARRNDAPPVMVRMSFKAPAPGEPAAETAATSTKPAQTPVEPVPAPPAVSAKTGPPAVVTVPAPPPAAAPAAVPAMAPKPPATATAATSSTTPPSGPVAPAATRKPDAPAQAAAPLAVTTVPPSPNKPSVPAPAGNARAGNATTSAEKTVDATGLGPSTPPPPPGSTLALVWKPTVDRLEQAPPPPRDYDVIEYGALSGYAGRYIRLLTAAGKKVEGRIIGVDGTTLSLRIQNSGGTAELQVPRSVIVEIQVPRRRDGSS